MNRNVKRTAFINKFETEVFCNIINVITVTFAQFNAFLLNKSINFFKKKKKNFEW